MRTRPRRRSRPAVRLISYPTAPVATDSARALAAVRPDPFRHRSGAPLPASPAGIPTGRQAGASRPQPRPPLRAVPIDEGSREADLTVAAMVIARAFAEVIGGIRPLHHLAGRATPEVFDRLATAIPVTASARQRPSRTLRVAVPLVQEPMPGVAEVCAVVFTGDHAQALALRLERLRGRWRCAAVETTLSPRHLRDHPTQRRGTAA